MGILLGILGVASAIGTTVASVRNRNIQAKEQKRELNVAENNLTASYNQAVRQQEESYNLANQQLDEKSELEISQIEYARDTSLLQSAKSTELQNQINNIERATLAVETSQAEGSAIQDVANSGFRATGSAVNIVENQRSVNDRALRNLALKISLSRYQDYNSALNNYTNANNQLESYRLQVQQQRENNRLNYQQNLESMKLDFDQKMEEIKYNQDYMNSSEFKFTQALGYANDIIGGAYNVYQAGDGELWNRPKETV